MEYFATKFNFNYMNFLIGHYYFQRMETFKYMINNYDIEMWQRLIMEISIIIYSYMRTFQWIMSFILRCLIVIIAGPIIILDILDITLYGIRLLSYTSKKIRYKLFLQLRRQ